MYSGISRVFICFMLLIAACIAKPSISFDANPNLIETPFTHNLTMRCALNDSDSPSDVRHITSLIVTRDGSHVATVTQYDPAKALTDLTSVHVTGDVNSAGAEIGYLELSWEYPTQDQAGTYTCEINGLDSLGHGIVFSENLGIDFKLPSVNELVDFAHQHQLDFDELILKNQQQQSTINQIMSKNKDQDTKIQQQETKIQQQATNIQQLTTTLTEQTNKIDHIMNTLSQPKHIESGVIDCHASQHWTDLVNNDKYKDVTVRFQTPYDKPPAVVHGLTYFWEHFQQSTFVYLDVLSVDKHGFTFRCRTLASYTVGVNVQWTSFPK